MNLEEFDTSYDRAYAELGSRGVARQTSKDALLVAAALGRAETGRRIASGHVDTIVTYDRLTGYTVSDVEPRDYDRSLLR